MAMITPTSATRRSAKLQSKLRKMVDTKKAQTQGK